MIPGTRAEVWREYRNDRHRLASRPDWRSRFTDRGRAADDLCRRAGQAARQRVSGAGAALANVFGILRVVFVGLGLLTLTSWAFFWMKQNGASDVLARVVAVNALVIGYRRGRYLAALFTCAPPLQVLFETAATPLRIWPRLLFDGFVFFFVEAEKLIIRLTRSSEGVAAVRAP